MRKDDINQDDKCVSYIKVNEIMSTNKLYQYSQNIISLKFTLAIIFSNHFIPHTTLMSLNEYIANPSDIPTRFESRKSFQSPFS